MTNEETLKQEIIDYLNEAPVVKKYSIPKTMVPLEYVHPVRILNGITLEWQPGFHKIWNQSSISADVEFRVIGDDCVEVFIIKKSLLEKEN